MTFREKLYNKIYNISNRNTFSDEVIDLMEIAYRDYKISLLTIVEFFYPLKKRTDKQAMVAIQDLIRKQYNIAYHNVGSDDEKSVFERYYKQENITEWLKLLHYLIIHFKSINKSESHVGNRRMAVTLGYLSPDETDKEKITKATRKISDLLYILKNELNVINVEQKYNYGQKGSWHKITANWHIIIELFRQSDDKADGSIRFRKTIKYRMISFLRWVAKRKNQTEAKWDRLKGLINKQKNKYLNGLVLYTESEDYQEQRRQVFEW